MRRNEDRISGKKNDFRHYYLSVINGCDNGNKTKMVALSSDVHLGF